MGFLTLDTSTSSWQRKACVEVVMQVLSVSIQTILNINQSLTWLSLAENIGTLHAQQDAWNMRRRLWSGHHQATLSHIQRSENPFQQQNCGLHFRCAITQMAMRWVVVMSMLLRLEGLRLSGPSWIALVPVACRILERLLPERGFESDWSRVSSRMTYHIHWVRSQACRNCSIICHHMVFLLLLIRLSDAISTFFMISWMTSSIRGWRCAPFLYLHVNSVALAIQLKQLKDCNCKPSMDQ